MSWFIDPLNFSTLNSYESNNEISSWEQVILTRYAGSQGNETNGVDAILEVNEAAKMTSDVSDDSSDQSNGGNRNNEGGVSVGNA